MILFSSPPNARHALPKKGSLLFPAVVLFEFIVYCRKHSPLCHQCVLVTYQQVLLTGRRNKSDHVTQSAHRHFVLQATLRLCQDYFGLFRQCVCVSVPGNLCLLKSVCVSKNIKAKALFVSYQLIVNDCLNSHRPCFFFFFLSFSVFFLPLTCCQTKHLTG